VLIGGADDPALEGIDRDLRGRTSLSQSLWLLKHSALHLGCDSFSNHAAGAFGHPAVIVFGSTSPTGSGYQSAVNLWAGLNCSPCYREDPRFSHQSRGPCINPPGQDYKRPRHACMAAIGVEIVWEAIDALLAVGTARGDGVPVDQAREPLLLRGG
jgi:ADP-heptose:LPS heptosyltransferase